MGESMNLASADGIGLKTVTRALVQACGGVEAGSAAARLSKTSLAACYDPHTPDRFLPVDCMLALERAAGDPVLTRHLAALQGFALVQQAALGGDFISQVVKLSREYGELSAAFALAHADGKLSAEDFQGLALEALQVAGLAMSVAAIAKERAAA
jgi:hypothetical protein